MCVFIIMSVEASVLDEKYLTVADKFEFPTWKSMGVSETDDKVNYLCGNSLGLMPKSTREFINKELDAWSARGVEAHFRNEITTDWVDVDLPLIPKISKIVGALESEVAVMGTLTMDLNSLLISFYQPDIASGRTKILFERGAFPSDYYAMYNLARLKGLDPKETLLQIEPLEGEFTLRTEEILKVLEDRGNEIALVCFSGIQYYTGQLFDIEKITQKGHEMGCTVGWDLAHAAGNINLKLHDWNVDFAAWCSYKYLNAGPGGIGGIFVHERLSKGDDIKGRPRLAGWWGNEANNRFKMEEKFRPIESALGFRQSNPSVLDVASLNSSLDVFEAYGGIEKLREKSIALTGFLEKLLLKSEYYGKSSDKPSFEIITPTNPLERGAQLSLLFHPENCMEKVMEYLHSHGTVCDERRPNVIRVAPTPLYNTFEDCVIFVKLLDKAMGNI